MKINISKFQHYLIHWSYSYLRASITDAVIQGADNYTPQSFVCFFIYDLDILTSDAEIFIYVYLHICINDFGVSLQTSIQYLYLFFLMSLVVAPSLKTIPIICNTFPLLSAEY